MEDDRSTEEDEEGDGKEREGRGEEELESIGEARHGAGWRDPWWAMSSGKVDDAGGDGGRFGEKWPLDAPSTCGQCGAQTVVAEAGASVIVANAAGPLSCSAGRRQWVAVRKAA